MPGRRAGWMRQRDKIDNHTCAFRAKFSSDHIFKFFEGQKLRDGEPSDGNNETRTQNSKLIIHPGRAISNFIRCRYAVATARRFAGETSADRGEVDGRSYRRLVQAAEFLEPTEQGFAGSPGEGLVQDWLANTRRLPE